MRNKLGNLNDHLFAQLERLSDEDLSAEQIEQEVKRAEAIVAISDQVVSNADLQLKAAKLYAEHGTGILQMLPQIGSRPIEGRAEEGDDPSGTAAQS